ncbi:hypothetical protein ATEIFO6365_0010043900 [Aspergillus terreus]|uniref:Uncharacterized protein n=1 Tax=Aspergillus terreus TaxID=33178 RepID=A0A5M3ZAZ6_ASPTE|nr:hypothetical protein ATETN484_0012042100 [Aspergillus terreus]GFF19659.1 hypothetical protein ATEIFO6365_0010043900 [Aspergillus terreus]
MADIVTPFDLAVQHLKRNAHPYNQRLSQKRRKTRMQGIDEFGRYIKLDTTQAYYHPQRGIAWTRPSTKGPKTPWYNLRSPCVSRVNPPRWWMTKNGIQVPESQNVHADELDGYKARNPYAGFENDHEALEDMWLEENARLHELEQAESTSRARGSLSMPQNVSEQPAVEPRDASKLKEKKSHKKSPKKKSTTEAEDSSRSKRSQEKAQRRSERAKKKKQKQERAEAGAS